MDTTVYPTRETYALKVWQSLDLATRHEILADYGHADGTKNLSQGDWAAFVAAFADNMDARHNGTVTFTRVDGGYTVQDDAEAGA